MPRSPEIATAAKPTISAGRAPKTIRARMSRPRWSVPRTWTRPAGPNDPGGRSRLVMSCSTGSHVVSHGAPSAPTTTSPTTTSPKSAVRRRARRRRKTTHSRRAGARAAGSAIAPAGTLICRGVREAVAHRGWPETGARRLRSSQADPRVEVRVEHVHDEVDEDERGGEQEDRRLHHGIVAVVDRLHRQAPDPRPREDRLGDHRAAEERAELDPDDRDDRDRGVLERVLPDDRGVAHALGPRRPDVVLVQHLEHPRACEPRDARGREEPERDRRQQEVLEPPPTRRGQQVPLDREDEDQHDAEPEGRHRLAEESDDRRDVVERRVAPHRRDDAGGHRQHERDQERRAREEAAVLHEEWVVEAHRLPEALDVLRGRVRRQQHQRGVAGEMQNEEDDERHAEQHQQRLEQPPREVDPHARESRATASMWGVCGNMSTGWTHSSRYPWRTRSPRSRASVAGLHDTYTSRAGASAASAWRAFGWKPARGGSATTTSAHTPSRTSVGSTWRTSPSRKVQFSIPFARAFRTASATAAAATSIPYTQRQ